MRLFVLLLAASSAILLNAQSLAVEPLDIHRIELSQAFPHKSVFPRQPQVGGIGFFTFDVPNHPDSKAPFSSYQVAMHEDKGTVYYVRATRPYTTLEECRRNAEALKTIEKRNAGTAVSTNDYSRFEARRGDEQIVIACSVQSGSPYADLEFMRRSFRMYEQLKAKWR